MAEHFKVIAIGGGPTGIATGVECVSFGLKPEDVLILEKGEACADAIRKFYPDKKMTLANYKGLPTVTHGHLSTFPDLTKIQTLNYFEDLIKKFQLQIRYKSEAYKVMSDGGSLRVQVGHQEVSADVIMIGIGILGRPNKPSYKLPTNLKNHLLFDITSQKLEGQKVLVVGGGDTSSEYCQVLEQDENICTLAVRGVDLSRMMESNQKALMKLVDAKRAFLSLETEVVEIVEDEGKPRVIFKNSEKSPSAIYDKVIFAIGGTTPLNFLKTAGIDCENNWPKYSETGRTNIPRLYLGGDLVAGKLGGSIITAYNSVFKSVEEFYPEIR